MNSFQDFIPQYIDYCTYQKNLDAKTTKAYRADLIQFFAFNADCTQMTKASVTRYIESLHNKYKSKTVKRKIASLKAYANYLDDEELLTTNPFQKMRIKYKEENVLPKTIPTYLLRKMLNILYAQHKQKVSAFSIAQSFRDIAVLELLFATGLRISELCHLNLNSFNTKARYIRVMGKGSKERFVQIENKEVLTVLKDYLINRSILKPAQNEDALFINRHGRRLSDQSVRFLINRCALQANAQIHITPHMFRHTFATMLLEEGVDIRYIQQILGHSSILTTQIYTRVSTKKQRSILLNKHPRKRLNVANSST